MEYEHVYMNELIDILSTLLYFVVSSTEQSGGLEGRMT